MFALVYLTLIYIIGCGELYIGTYNVRSLMGEDRLEELEQELQSIKWHVIGLAETRRQGTNIIQLKNGNILYTVRNESKSEHGVSFLIHRDLASNVIEYKSSSERVAMVVLRLSKKYSVKIVQVYAPTSAHDDEEIEDMYEEINQLLDSTNSHYTMVIGDFNAKIGKQRSDETNVMGKYGIGQRNERGDRLIEFAVSRGLYIANGKFQKKGNRLWTWRSPDGNTRNEIDFIMTNRPDTIKDVVVMNRVNTGSDHLLVRCKVDFHTKIERSKLIGKKKLTINCNELQRKRLEY